jgi:hypothetical protein
VGLAKSNLVDGRLEIVDVRCGGNSSKLLDSVSGWIQNECRVLLALDAPLGWPFPLRSALAKHEAGLPIGDHADKLLRRETDRVITQQCKRRPLDVGADRIARTAHSALRLLGELAERFGAAIPLAWNPSYPGRIAAIEVYPAATLSGRKIRCSQYKAAEDREARREILDKISEHVAFSVDTSNLLDDADVLDAVVCAIGGADFMRGHALQPSDEVLARNEGWIWAKLPQPSARSPQLL